MQVERAPAYQPVHHCERDTGERCDRDGRQQWRVGYSPGRANDLKAASDQIDMAARYRDESGSIYIEGDCRDAGIPTNARRDCHGPVGRKNIVERYKAVGQTVPETTNMPDRK